MENTEHTKRNQGSRGSPSHQLGARAAVLKIITIRRVCARVPNHEVEDLRSAVAAARIRGDIHVVAGAILVIRLVERLYGDWHVWARTIDPPAQLLHPSDG